MKISVVMVDGQFRESFHFIDCLNNQSLPRQEYELIWVEFYDYVRDELKTKKGVKVILLGNSQDTMYHSSFCFNEGIRQSQGEIVVIPDPDVLVKEDFLKTIKDEHQSCDDLALYFNRLNEKATDHHPIKSYQMGYLEKRSELDYANNYGACVTVKKKWLLEINGYEEDPAFSSGFHANGFDVNTRLKNLGLHIKWHPSVFLYHPWHPSTLSGSEKYNNQMDITNQRLLNLTTLPNYGLDPGKNKSKKEIPSEGLAAAKSVNPLMKIKRYLRRKLTN